MEEKDYIYNCASSLRHEYKCLQALEHGLYGLKVSIKVDSESLSKYECLEHLSEFESQRKNDLSSQITRAQEYIHQMEEEIANFPPFPELPPTKPLIKISGILEEVSFKKVIGYFAYTEYSTEIQRAEEKLKRDNKGAVFLLLAQLFAGATPLAKLNDGRRKQYKCLYVKGRLDGKVFSGWLNHTNIQIGDYLEMAVIPEGEAYRMYAVTNPQQGTISTTPGCHGGSRWFTTQSLIKMSAVPFAVIILLPALFASLTLEKWGYALLIYLSLTGAFYLYLRNGLVNEYRAPGDLFERICTALNIANGRTINLKNYTERFIKEKQKKGEKITPESEDISTSQRRAKQDYDFYFYPLIK